MEKKVPPQEALRDKSGPKDKMSHVELELWLERNLREGARNAKRGSMDRLKIFKEMLERAAISDQVFGPFIDTAVKGLFSEKESNPPEVLALQRLMEQEKKLNELKADTVKVEAENSALKRQLEELQHHIKRRQQEVNDLEATMRQKSDFFEKQRNLNDELNSLFGLFDEPIEVKEEHIERDAPQIVSLRIHNQTLRDNIKAMQKFIQIAEDEVTAIKSLR